MNTNSRFLYPKVSQSFVYELKEEIVMNTLMKTLVILTAISLLVSACGGRSVQAESAEANPTAISYQVVLGKSLNDRDVVDFLASNNCSTVNRFHLCKEIGMALWAEADQIVKMVYLYAGNVDEFRRYRGPLPYGLTFYDPMWRVEEKIRDLNSDDSLSPQEIWQAGLPEEEASPDHMHYWAMYKKLGMTVIYNSPGDDEDAYIYAIVVYNW
ncbi:MAG TPA: hypothetical protein VJM08_09490 [Anaerolineales bacterium]|nr:hypothetical protein [Anaerolineales bacterium]